MESLTTNEDNHFTEDDIKDSLNAFRENYRTFPRKDIEKLTGVSIPANKRNGRKQEVHLEIARATRDITQKINGTNWRENNGRKNKSHIIAIWRLKNPEGTKYACQKQTGLSKNTIKLSLIHI